MLGISLCAVDRSRLIYGNPTALCMVTTYRPPTALWNYPTSIPPHLYVNEEIVLGIECEGMGELQDLDRLCFDDPVIDVRSLLTGLGDDMDVTAVLCCWLAGVGRYGRQTGSYVGRKRRCVSVIRYVNSGSFSLSE